jgi:hypothetical protein
MYNELPLSWGIDWAFNLWWSIYIIYPDRLSTMIGGVIYLAATINNNVNYNEYMLIIILIIEIENNNVHI